MVTGVLCLLSFSCSAAASSTAESVIWTADTVSNETCSSSTSASLSFLAAAIAIGEAALAPSFSTIETASTESAPSQVSEGHPQIVEATVVQLDTVSPSPSSSSVGRVAGVPQDDQVSADPKLETVVELAIEETVESLDRVDLYEMGDSAANDDTDTASVSVSVALSEGREVVLMEIESRGMEVVDREREEDVSS